jgi:hemerythrin
MGIQWTPEFSVGLEEIDEQHKELFNRINVLLNACNQGQGKQIVGETIDFLEQYVKNHFGSEEKQMIKFAYPEYLPHRKEHQQFIESFSEIKERFEEDGPGLHIVVLTNKIVVDWLKNHIIMTDTKLGSFLKGKLSK